MNAHVETWLAHIRALAVDIGPRGPTTEGERRGARYCAEALRQLGLTPQVEGFTSATSIFQPHLIAAGTMLLAPGRRYLRQDGPRSAGPRLRLHHRVHRGIERPCRK